MAEATDTREIDKLRISRGFWVAMFGLLLVGVAFLASLARFTTAADVSAAVGAVSGIVGTVVGAFFGVNVGAAGKEKAENSRDQAENKALALAAELPQERAREVLAGFR